MLLIFAYIISCDLLQGIDGQKALTSYKAVVQQEKLRFLKKKIVIIFCKQMIIKRINHNIHNWRTPGIKREGETVYFLKM